MTTEQIEKFLEKNGNESTPVKVSFKTRKPVIGLFITTGDYNDLKSKNFWRIVGEANLESYNKSKDMSLARIFNGSEMTKLSVL
jgi:hypothetical protein